MTFQIGCRRPELIDRIARCLRRAGASPTVRAAREVGLDLLALVWPCACAVCGAPDRQICSPCLEALGARDVWGCAPVAAQGRAEWVRTSAGVYACVAGPYSGPLRALLVGYKHGGRTGFAPVLGAQLRAPLRTALRCSREPAPLVVAAPSRPARVRERGYRHLDLLVRRALRDMRVFGRPRPLFVAGALRALPGRTGQVGLTQADRSRNAALVQVPARMRFRLCGREVVLVDDIVTTGATAAAASRALVAAGARVVAVVAICATERSDESVRIRGPEGTGAGV